jgi:hypothetical protein
MREFSGAVSVVLALAIVCTLVTIDRVVMARTPEQEAKQPGMETIQCDDTGHYLTRLYHHGDIVYEKPNPGRNAEAGGAPAIGQAAQPGCQAPGRGASGGGTSGHQPSSHRASSNRTSGTM